MARLRAIGLLLGALLLVGCAANKPQPAGEEEFSLDDVRAQADLAWQHGNNAAAVEGYRKILRREPANRDALLGIGEAWLGMGASAEALVAFDELLKTDPGAIDAAEGRALALLGLQHNDDARQLFADIEARAPGRWRTRNALGLLADLQGEYDTARDWYRQALAVNPREATVLNNMGWSRVMARDFREGERLLQEALARKPGVPRINANLAVAIAWQGDYARALRVALRTAPEHVANNDIGYIALLRGDADAAVGYLQSAIDTSPSWFARAAANLERAKRTQATRR